MRVIFLSDFWTVVLCFAVWPILQIGAALICINLSNRFLSSDFFVFRVYKFEKSGKVYDAFFNVSRWKHLLPDGGAVWKKRGFKKKRLENFSAENLNRFLIESARGELSHWIAMLPFWVFWFFTPPIVPWLMLLYAFAVNLPCIIAQRYNRPRVRHLINLMKQKQLEEYQ